MEKTSIVFFGSFLEYSASILRVLHQSDQFEILGVVTTPPRPAGRKKELKPTDVYLYALEQRLPVFTPEKLDSEALDHLLSATGRQPTLLCVAGYGKLLPQSWLEMPRIAPINIHFSLLPKYRGAMPGEWAIFMGESETGVSLIEMSPKLDAGNIISQAKYQIKDNDTRESLYTKLYELGAELFLATVDQYLSYKLLDRDHKPDNTPQAFDLPLPRGDQTNHRLSNQQLDRLTSSPSSLLLPPQPQGQSAPPYARLIGKDETFVDWRLVQAAIRGQSPDESLFTDLLQELPSKSLTAAEWAKALERMIRAFYGWPGVWTIVDTPKGPKRMKLIAAHLESNLLSLDQVQLEGGVVERYVVR